MRLYRKSGSAFIFTHYSSMVRNERGPVGSRLRTAACACYNQDVLDLYPLVPVGTLVQTRQ